jgi:hypothetical protein
MTEDQLIDVGMYRLKYPLANFEIVLDTRLSTITFMPTDNRNNGGANNPPGGPQTIINLRLGSFASFEEDLRRLRPGRFRNDLTRLDALLSYLKHMTGNRELPAASVWRDALGDFSLLLLRYARKNPGPLFDEARDLILWLGAIQPKSAWRLSFNTRLSFEHRYKLLTSIPFPNNSASAADRDGSNHLDVPEAKERQLCWWITMRRYELAREWCETEVYNSSARKALRDETLHYLHVLKDEQRQQDLRRFLSECGTDIETEVKKVLFNPARTRRRERAWQGGFWSSLLRLPKRLWQRIYHRRPLRLRSAKSNTGSGLAEDEVIRRAFVVWFLKRYDLLSAIRLVVSGPNRRRFRSMGVAYLFLNAVAVLLYIIQLDEPRLRFLLPAPGNYAQWLWAGQVLLQLSSLFLLLFFAPTLFRLLMPRALFGSLLAWCTVIFLALKDVHEFTVGEADQKTSWHLTTLCHGSTLSDPQTFGYSMLVGAGMIALGAVFVGYTVTQFIQGFWKTLRRTVAMLCILLLGAMFWGIALALPIKATLEGDTFRFDCHCVIPIIVIGSSISVLFGLMVELIWQDESLAEPLGEPL